MKFKIGKFTVGFELAPKRTVWWVQLPETKNQVRQRIDALVALQRIFARDLNVYVYQIHLGRLQIMICDHTQKVKI